ncbi:hypothetical protein P175DRAFT_0501469 [Aspergillus ochraceoroseus IBT 24754]|uniref:Aminoglycoside phosphotransferase domain-containing protein n=2 Tax=Aspergillus ochraceoroseus TaxID=138278 RepID=A0A2T5LX17_9EURO|nr:uncharacterized protein P175DRAFT_0501469 [Aspergillus ochraceoroseus IBT 24754]KKK12435.1 hypothetical protein AOCH_000441 [Aspergillus ochraceoroseus]PTU20832.1 hypothetical protein P175DRAFT_0501469 [Aspergillus ochraceoroseus IBT 24754]
MDDYQSLVVAQFFESLPNLSQESCHRFALHHIAPILHPNTPGKVDIQPSAFQGSMSYTIILHTHFTDANHRIAVQFRSDKQDLFGVTEASHIHGSIVPLVTYQGMYEGLFVYTSPFAEGTPYISVLMSSEDFHLPLPKKRATVMDLADLVTRGARTNTARVDSALSDLTSTLERIQHTVNNYSFRHATLRNKIFACIRKLLLQLPNLTTLPVTLTHQDLAPFNYLIDDSTGRVQAVLDWDGALYLPVGSNFHFMDSLFGFMTPRGWQDTEDRQELETAFYNRVLAHLAAQGFEGITKEQLESQKAIGMLLYGVDRLLKFKDERAEHYLDGYLRGLQSLS